MVKRRGTLAIAPEVELAVIESGGQASIDRLRAVDEFRCLVCSLDGRVDLGEDVSLAVLSYDDGTLMRLTHARCGPSAILPMEGNRPAFGGPFNPEIDVVSLALSIPGPDGTPESLLLLDRSEPSGFMTPEGAILDPAVQEHLREK